MRKIAIILSLILISVSCKSSKNSKRENSYPSNSINEKPIVKVGDIETFSSEKNEINPKSDTINVPSNKVHNIISYAKQFDGVKYKFGGTTKAGMDCSGLIYESFKAFDIYLPRISRDMAKQGDKILLESIEEGDLLFFKTNNKRNTISHVGLVVTARPGNIEFIHSTSGQGVIVSSLAERYWYFSFVEARRIL